MSASTIQPQVQGMIDNPGIYVCTDHGGEDMAVVIFSVGGLLIPLVREDRALDPTRFNDTLKISHGPLGP